MKAWITKYALTKGIMEVTGEVAKTSPEMFCYKLKGYEQYAHGEGTDWHRTLESAIQRAEDMRVKKISSLHRSIKQLEVLSFP